MRQQRSTLSEKSSEAEAAEVLSSNAFLRGVVALCVLMQFYLHPWLLHLLPVPAAVFALRRLWIFAAMRPRFDALVEAVRERAMEGPHADILFPEPVRRMFRFVIGVEHRMLGVMPAYVDTLVAAFLILLGIIVS